jgi:RHS repeat-associated protein
MKRFGIRPVADVQVDLTYNPAGQPQTVTRYVGGQLAVTASYSYDSDDNLTGLVYSQGGTTLASYSYTYAGSSVQSLIPNPQSLLSSGSAELNWTPGSNVILPSTNPSQTPLDILSGSTSPTNLIASATSVDGTANYSYDPAGQLTGATYGGSQPDEAYSYDSNGNRTNTGYVIGPDNELLSDGTYNYSYDAEGNRIERTNIATGAVTDYVWDNRDRLVEVIDRASAGGAITQDVHYYYDAENRWIGETVSIPGGAVENTSYAYCGNQIVLQFDGTSSTSPLGVANLSNRYLWGPAVDQILAGEQVTSLTQPGNVLLPLTNNVGTVCDLAQYNAGTGTTTVVDHRVYDSFGNLVSQTNAAVDFVFGFTGRPLDEATGLQNNGNRWYDAKVERWLSRDPMGFLAGDPNFYRYVGNVPTNASDPFGLYPYGSPEWFYELPGHPEAYITYFDTGRVRVIIPDFGEYWSVEAAEADWRACRDGLEALADDAPETTKEAVALVGATGTGTAAAVTGVAAAVAQPCVIIAGGCVLIYMANDIRANVIAASEVENVAPGYTGEAPGFWSLYWSKLKEDVGL